MGIYKMSVSTILILFGQCVFQKVLCERKEISKYLYIRHQRKMNKFLELFL